MANQQMFDGNFEDILNDVNNVYLKHKPKKGNSWKQCETDYLHSKLVEELDEFDESGHNYRGLYDVILVAIMLAKRLKDNENL